MDARGARGGATLTRILRLAAGGDGVGKLEDGRTVFVPRTAPGDLLALTAVRTHARFARGRIGEVLEPGAGRVPPRCAHYLRDACGGCQLQHLDYPAQLAAKQGIVEDALRRIGRLDVAVPALIPASNPWEYRSRITLAVGPGRRFAGFHPLDRPEGVFALERCEIAEPAVRRLWDAVREGLHHLPPDTEHLVLRVDRGGGLHLVVRARGEQAWGGGPRLAAVAKGRGVDVTVWWEPAQGALRVVSGDRELFPATVFEQVHTDLGDRIREDAVQRLGVVADRHAWDLYAGIGETSARLARLGATVESVELDRRAVEYAEGCEVAGVAAGTIRRHVGRVEELVARLAPPAVVIANPPRAGMEGEVAAALIARRPERIVYISCDPATLARDLGRLAGTTGATGGSFTVTQVQSYDLFPQTAHVETVAVLEA